MGLVGSGAVLGCVGGSAECCVLGFGLLIFFRSVSVWCAFNCSFSCDLYSVSRTDELMMEGLGWAEWFFDCSLRS